MRFSFGDTSFGKIVLALVTVSFLWLGAFGLTCRMGEMTNESAMNTCLFNIKESICTMNFSEIVSLWQGMFAGLQQDLEITSLFLCMIAVAAVCLLNLLLLYGFSEHIFSRWRLYLKKNSYFYFFNSLREAFSQGIINPKIYGSIA